MFHNSKAVMAIDKEPNDTVFQKTLGLNDFYVAGDDGRGNHRQWPLGNIQMIGKWNAAAMRGEEPKLTALAPTLSLDEIARHAVDFWLTTEDVPKPGNRVTVDKLRTIMNHIGIAAHHVLDKNFYMDMRISVAGVAHQAGTCRFGTDPRT